MEWSSLRVGKPLQIRNMTDFSPNFYQFCNRSGKHVIIIMAEQKVTERTSCQDIDFIDNVGMPHVLGYTGVMAVPPIEFECLLE
jgi:hypothetical protein